MSDFKRIYITENDHPHLAEECIVLLRSFYGVELKRTDDIEQAEYVIQIQGNQLSFKQLKVSNVDPIDFRLFVKQQLYDYLSVTLNRTLPWGILQGIRPTKLVFKLLEGGSVKETLMNKYRLREAMADLCIQVAQEEKPYVKGLLSHTNSASIYIGIPFCPSRCLYCSFTSNVASKWSSRMDAYVDALIREWNAYFDKAKDQEITTLYMGGGTPTTLSVPQMERLLNAISQKIDLTALVEFTVEAGRPLTIYAEMLELLSRYHVTRLSINPQTMNQQTLDIIGRKHTVENIIEAYHLARKSGKWRINMDLIVGLPGESEKDLKYTLDLIDQLSPDEITVHTLAIKRSSRLHEHLEEYPQADNQTIERMLSLVKHFMIEKGYKPYYLYRQKNIAGGHENVGYYKGEIPGIYNMAIMEEVQTILAFGAGTVTKIVKGNKVNRIENVKNVEIYIDRSVELAGKKLKSNP